MSSKKLSLRKLCLVAGISRSTFYEIKNGSQIEERDEFTAELIKDIHYLKNEKYGLVTKVRRRNKFKMLTKQDGEHSVVENLVKREFDIQKPDQIYSTDITMIDYGPGKRAYLSAVKDLGAKDIVLHTISSQITMDIARKGLKEMLEKLPLEVRKNLILHSDQGTHYTHKGFRDLLKEVKVNQSMSRKGNCIANAPIESFFGHLKDEMDFGACRNIEELVKETAKYIDYYNNQRPQWGLGKRTPAKCRGSG